MEGVVKRKRKRGWMGRGAVMGFSLWVGPAIWGEVVELGAYEVEAWAFDSLGMRVAAEVRRLELAELEATGLGSVPAMLEQLAGVRFSGYTGSGAEGQLAMRGFGENSGLRVLVLVDGQVYNPADMGGINWQGVRVEELEVVEVIRGGQGVLYGNHAVSGVIKLETRDPGGEWRGEARTVVGSEAWREGFFGMEGSASGLGLRAGVHAMETAGYREHSGTDSQSGYVTWQVGLAGLGDWRGRVQREEQWTQFPGPLSAEQMAADPRQSVNRGRDGSERAQVTATFRGTGDWGEGAWELTGGWLERSTDWELDGYEGDNWHRRWTGSPRVKVGTESRFVVTGVDLNLDWLRSREWTGTTERRVRARAELERVTGGAYVYGSFLIGEKWRYSGGWRRERAETDTRYVHYKLEQLFPTIETNRGVVANPAYRDPPEADPALSFEGPVDKAGWAAEGSLSYAVSEQLSWWAGWDRVYRYPAVDETASFQGYPLADPLNTALRPETGDNWETGLKWEGGNWRWGATVFHMDLEDEIIFDGEARLNVNAGRTRRVGLEMSGAVETGKMGLSGRFSWTRARFEESGFAYHGKRLPLVPEYEAAMTFWRALPAGLRLRLHVQALSRQVQGNDYLNTQRRLAGYGLADLTLFWRPHPAVRCVFGVSNLFDKAHAVSAYSGGFYPGPGRRLRAEFTLQF